MSGHYQVGYVINHQCNDHDLCVHAHSHISLINVTGAPLNTATLSEITEEACREVEIYQRAGVVS